MSWYTLALFAHIVGVLTLFISMATQWIITLRVRRAGSIAQVREWCGLAKGIGRVAPVTGVLIVGAGIYQRNWLSAPAFRHGGESRVARR